MLTKGTGLCRWCSWLAEALEEGCPPLAYEHSSCTLMREREKGFLYLEVGWLSQGIETLLWVPSEKWHFNFISTYFIPFSFPSAFNKICV